MLPRRDGWHAIEVPEDVRILETPAERHQRGDREAVFRRAQVNIVSVCGSGIGSVCVAKQQTKISLPLSSSHNRIPIPIIQDTANIVEKGGVPCRALHLPQAERRPGHPGKPCHGRNEPSRSTLCSPGFMSARVRRHLRCPGGAAATRLEGSARAFPTSRSRPQNETRGVPSSERRGERGGRETTGGPAPEREEPRDRRRGVPPGQPPLGLIEGTREGPEARTIEQVIEASNSNVREGTFARRWPVREVLQKPHTPRAPMWLRPRCVAPRRRRFAADASNPGQQLPGATSGSASDLARASTLGRRPRADAVTT